jgi:hypothetical protein
MMKLKLNLTCIHIVLWELFFIIVQLLNWVGIYLYLVIANKILTNIVKKRCSTLIIFLDKPYTSYEPPP